MWKEKNKLQWEKFAQDDARYYIDTTSKNLAQFWQKGEENFHTYLLPIFKKYKVKPDIGIDFGCGIGRHTFPLTKYFQTVIGVDVSHNMLKQANTFAQEKNIPNTQFIQNDEFFEYNKPVDFIYSVNVFQHLEDLEQIKKILDHMAHLLHGYAYLHFDTRPPNGVYHLKNKLPNFLLTRSQRRGIRRIRRNSKEIEAHIKKLGFSIIEQWSPRSKNHFLLLKK